MNPQDRPKVIAIVIGIVLAIGFMFKTLIASRSGEPDIAPVATAPPPQKGPTADETEKLLAENSPKSPAYTGVDPFRTVLPNPGAPSGAGIAGAPSTVAKGIKDSSQGTGPTGIANPFGTGIGTGTSPINPTPPPEALIKVEGVMIDGGRMAILSVNKKTEFLTIGNSIGDGFVIVGIEPRAVTFQRKGKRISVEVGSILGGPAFQDQPKAES